MKKNQKSTPFSFCLGYSFIALICGFTLSQTCLWGQSNDSAYTHEGVFAIEPPNSSLVLEFPSDITLLERPNITAGLLIRRDSVKFKGSISREGVLEKTPFTERFHQDREFPGLFIASPISECLFLGAGLVRPKDLDLFYQPPPESFLRYDHNEATNKIWQATLVAAWKINECFAIGGGVDYYDFNLISSVSFPSSEIPFDSTLDGYLHNDVDFHQIGYHLSLTADVPRYKTHILVSYRSAVEFKTQFTSLLTENFLENSQTYVYPLERKGTFVPPKLILNISRPFGKNLALFSQFQYTWAQCLTSAEDFDPQFNVKFDAFFFNRNSPELETGFVYKALKCTNLGASFTWGTTARRPHDSFYKGKIFGTYLTRCGNISFLYLLGREKFVPPFLSGVRRENLTNIKGRFRVLRNEFLLQWSMKI